MKTTATPRVTRAGGASALLGAGLVVGVLGAVAVVLGALVSGSAAAYGALVGTLVVLAVLGLGSVVVSVIAGAMPTAALLVALLTYTLQVLLMGLLLAVLAESGVLDSALDAEWLGGTVIVGTLLWLGSQIVLTSRLRIPAYDLPEAGER